MTLRCLFGHKWVHRDDDLWEIIKFVKENYDSSKQKDTVVSKVREDKT